MAERDVGPDGLLPPPRNFAQTLEEKVRAQGGVPAHLRRKRDIEDLIAQALATLREARAKGVRGAALEARARTLDLEPLNGLIDRHNRYYPIEARLPIDPRSGGLLELGQPWRPMAFVTAETLLAWMDAPP